MTGPKGNREFCSPENLNVPLGEVFCYTPNSEKLQRSCLIDTDWLTNKIFRGFKEHRLMGELKVQIVVSQVS